MRIGIVNDMLRWPARALRLNRAGVIPGHQIAWTAQDAWRRGGRAGGQRDRPDLILMDLIMPVMDGVEATRRIMAECPCADRRRHRHGQRPHQQGLRSHGPRRVHSMPSTRPCSAPGATCAVHLRRRAEGEDRHDRQADGQECPVSSRVTPPSPRASHSPASRCGPRRSGLRYKDPVSLVLLGSLDRRPERSGRDPRGACPRTWNACVVIVQHVDVAFAPGLAQWPVERTARHTVRAQRAEGDDARPPAAVLLAATNDHMVLSRPTAGSTTSSEPKEMSFRPSVDRPVPAASADHWLDPGVAVLSDRDGPRRRARGCFELRTLMRWHTIAQDEATSSIVYGMPKAAATLASVNSSCRSRRSAPPPKCCPCPIHLIADELSDPRFDPHSSASVGV